MSYNDFNLICDMQFCDFLLRTQSARRARASEQASDMTRARMMEGKSMNSIMVVDGNEYRSNVLSRPGLVCLKLVGGKRNYRKDFDLLFSALRYTLRQAQRPSDRSFLLAFNYLWIAAACQLMADSKASPRGWFA
jgi:hypothetical protein